MAHIRKFDFDHSRRHFLEKTARGFGSAGVLGALWPIMCESGDISRAYPEELLSIEAYTKGKVKTGDWITKDNIDLVQDLVDAGLYEEVTQMGRTFQIQATTTDVTKMFPYEFLEATMRNQGLAKLDDHGNVWTNDGSQWIGGLPFPEAEIGLHVIANQTLSWGRHDESTYAVQAEAISKEGERQYEYNLVWAEQAASGRTADPNGHMLSGGRGDGKLRYQSTWFTSPNDVKGTAFPQCLELRSTTISRLVRLPPGIQASTTLSTNQRFEPLVAGLNFFFPMPGQLATRISPVAITRSSRASPFSAARKAAGWDQPKWRPDFHAAQRAIRSSRSPRS